MFEKFSKLGQAFMLPIAILPVAGLLLGLGSALSNDAALAQFPFLANDFIQAVFTVMTMAGNAVFANLPLIFSIGIAVGLSEADHGTAGLSAGVAFLVYTATISAWLQLFSAPDATIDTGVLGALLIGLTVTYLHNRYRKIELPQFLGFFGGNRFIPIVSAIAAIFLGSIIYVIWPPIQEAMVGLGEQIAAMGSIGSFFYGFFLRLTGAVGLHHTIYPLFWYTSLGGVETVAGQTIEGAQNIYFAQLADPNFTGLYTYGTRFFAGRFATMMFGLPAATLAMYHSIPKENRPANAGFYFSSGLTSFLTGITEPIEFSFLFAAPWLYVIHAFLDGVSFYIADILQIRIGNTFSGGLIDFLLFGPFQGNSQTNWIRVIPVGIIWAILYYIVFRFCIKKFHVTIPGMEMTDDQAKSGKTRSSQSSGSLHDKALTIIEGLGGPENIDHVTACATRLRVSVKENGKVNKDTLKSLGATGVLDVKNGIQAIYGGKSNIYSAEINEILADSNFSKATEAMSLFTPVAGSLYNLSEVNDPVFSQGTMGQGLAIRPESDQVISPVNGVVTSLFETGHAIGLTSEEGIEILIHIGLDTVELKGQGFTPTVKQGDKVTIGDHLITFDRQAIESAGYDTSVILVVTNTSDYDQIETVANGEVGPGDEIIRLHK
ncbi:MULTISPECIES: PTS transporter subunit IIABC [Aerococcus]|uniref:PTS transporter subunit IIABC n=1 Tax=Aerococcus TaxID=1375 RepID=UPI000DCC7429|nr:MULTISPECIES: PTS transporter subunit IIABC [Aerococcus]KAA9297963.1 PTS sugar transporter subunit IIABC [Aerococcus tenax]MDK6689472.1 glucose PTS transporter subunit IIA [Aerococcus urinae]MDK8133404.1 glucose PTS transporter subunit IIA [Aerococcus urinae]MDK8484919.1 glucose PTS transporter subunit IIA [Aerococcus urinae]MDL5178970.1 glucose PTS transporter subunit IIA [Aerococcus tenax]